MNPEPLHVISTNSATESHGQLLKQDLPQFRKVMLVFFLGLAVFTVLATRGGVGLSTAFWVILAPAGLCGLLLFLLVTNRHPSYARDLSESMLTGGDAAPGDTGSFRRSSWLDLMPDGYFVEGLLVFNGLGPGGWVAKGFWLGVPDLLLASDEERDRLLAQVRRLLRFLPKDYRLQVRWWVDSDYHAALVRQQARTAQTDNAEAQRENNFAILQFVDLMKRDALRRQHLALFVSRRVADKPGVPCPPPKAEQLYGDRLAALQTEFAELGRNLQTLFAAVGGNVTPMTDADHHRLLFHALNPSLAHRPGSDHQAAFDPRRSILDLCLRSQLRGRGRRGFWLDDYEHGVLVLSRWPAQVFSTIMHRLTLLPFNDYTITVQTRKLPVAELLARTQRELDRLNTLLAAKPDARVQVTKEKLEERIQRLTQGEQVPLATELIIVVRARNPEALSERMLAIKSALHGLGGAEYVEGLSAFSKNCFFKTLPGCSWIPHRGYELFGEEDVVGAMLPLSCSFNAHLDSAEAIYLGTHGNLVGLRTFTV